MKEDLLIEAMFTDRASAYQAAIGHVNHSSTLQATSCADGERGTAIDVIRDVDLESLDSYLRKNPSGCFLFGKGFQIQVDLYDNIPSRIVVWAKIGNFRVVNSAHHLCHLWDDCGADYAYGAAWSEYHARNGVMYERGEGWAGRDFQRYVPGLYWMNYFSHDYASKFGIDLTSLTHRCAGRRTSLPNGEILFLYESPEQWINRDAEIRHVIAETPGFFSMSRVNVPENMSPIEHLNWIDELHEKWP